MRTRDFDKQQRIKEAIVTVFLREGINGASISKIAQEASVSPATIYVYYSNKEEMLAEVFKEYSHQSYYYLTQRMQPEMSGRELIETIVRGFYAYTVEHEEAFSFVEQCSRCPSLSEAVCDNDSCCEVFDIIHQYQNRGILKKYSDPNISAVLFSPVRCLAINGRSMRFDAEAELDELVEMMQSLLLN
ncbi:MAG: TetR/AcrR family transcriptional regulator [Lachnospiraceae bacterium]|nr:TetR/AcrR family transcriptional regulator [Lachnospiraceae bacterium]MBR3004907.1 TetR/AcrR family transcriptional regulator [Lachnospiraceae bacterium]